MQAPSERIEMRRWLQELGSFKAWADRTFLVPSANGGTPLRTGFRIPKLIALGKEGNEQWSYYAQNPDLRKFMTEQIFKRKLWIWAMLSGYIINPGKVTTLKMLSEYKGLSYGGDDKSGGQEWFLIYHRQPICHFTTLLMAHFYKYQKGIYNGLLITGAKGNSTYELVFESYGKGDFVEMSLKNVFTDTSAAVTEEVLLDKLTSGEIWPLNHPYMPSAKWLKSIGEGTDEPQEEPIDIN
jgi:hypothetical protein